MKKFSETIKDGYTKIIAWPDGFWMRWDDFVNDDSMENYSDDYFISFIPEEYDDETVEHIINEISEGYKKNRETKG